MSLIAVRHGRTPSSELGLIARDEESLSIIKGPLDAIKAGRAALALLAGAQFDEIVASPVRRATESAGIIGREIGVAKGYVIDPDLAPRGMGGFRGEHVVDVPWQDPIALAAHGVEPAAAFIERTARLFEELRQEQPGNHVLLVAHASGIRLLARLAGLATEQSHVACGDALKLL
jgi:uncharacterized phosphatase